VSGTPEFAEIVDLPGDVREFSHHRRAGIAEVTSSARVRLDTLARWAQDVAWADVADVGLQELTIWLVRRTTIRVNRFPRLDDRYRLTTCVTGTGRMWAERRTDMVRADEDPGRATVPDVQVACIWVHIDPERLQPSSIQQVEYDTWTGPNTRSVKARLKHPAPPAGASEGRWTFRSAELDVADHINNTAYWTPLDDELAVIGGPEPATLEAEIEYRTAAQPGPKRWLVDGGHRWLADPGADGELIASMAIDLTPASR
jgi:acyl-ACP thioesterase